MVVKLIESTYDSVKDKLKNPFYGTLLIIWVIRNREFIFNVFFNENVNSDVRLGIIRSHFLTLDSLLSFVGTIFISLGLMVLIYFSLNLSRLIVELSERVLKPKIQEFFSKTSIVSREDFVELEKERDYFQKKYSEERVEKTSIQRELDDLLNQKIENSQEKDEASTAQGSKRNPSPTQSKNESESKARNIIERWEQYRPSYIEDLKIMIPMVKNRKQTNEIRSAMQDLGSMKEFENKGIIEVIEFNGRYYFNFTSLGDELIQYVPNFS